MARVEMFRIAEELMQGEELERSEKNQEPIERIREKPNKPMEKE